MIRRFSLYGFLKNQQYYDPFLILAFRAKGLSFTEIGLLIGFRELCVNLMEIPTGAIADVAGRRRSMIFSFLAYIGAFLVFGLCRPIWTLFGAMFCFSIGEAFRTGTHKAIIFDWLKRQGRPDEKTRVYGYTRSWSKMGSAVSVVIAAALVFWLQDYTWMFLICIVPYALNIVNFLTYPSYLDGRSGKHASMRRVWGTLWQSMRRALGRKPLRRLLLESMGFEGVYRVTKDYAQPVVKAAAVALPAMLWANDMQRTAVLVGAVYFVLYLLSSYASRHAAALAQWAGSEAKGARRLWWVELGVFALLTAGLAAGVLEQGAVVLAIVAFVVLSMIQNFWRPMLITRVSEHAGVKGAATVLSIESQAKCLFAALIAPLLGLAVDVMPENLRFLPVGVLGLAIAAAALAAGGKDATEQRQTASPDEG